VLQELALTGMRSFKLDEVCGLTRAFGAEDVTLGKSRVLEDL
jgi:hypothetical protein